MGSLSIQKTRQSLAPIHKSLTRPQFIAGCDRELFILVCLAAILLIGPGGIMSRSLFNIILGTAVFFIGVSLLSWMGKKDAQMRHVFMRCVTYKDRYPARSAVTSAVHRHRHNMRWV